MKQEPRSVFITGGTGSVGKALIQAFFEHGDRITFQYFNNHNLAKELEKTYSAKPINLDFTSKNELPEHNFQIILNNAGINITNVLSHKVSIEDWNNTLAVNLTFPFLIIQKYLPEMLKNKWGRIINISSIYGLRAPENNLPYNVSKHALSGLTRTVAKEYAPYGITCNEICPGPIESELINRVAARKSKVEGQSVEQYIRELCEEIPAKRLATPDEVAKLALFLSLDTSSYINGTSIPLDGGLII